MSNRKKYLFLPAVLFCLLSLTTIAQENKPDPVWRQDTIIGNNVFRKHSNWLSGGIGIAKHNQLGNRQYTNNVDFNFHIHTEYFQLGILLSGDDMYGNYNNYQFHFCYGKRVESSSINFSYFGGVSYATFFEWTGQKYSDYSKTDVGLYANAQYIVKIKFDVGIGIGAFVDVNFHQSVMGAKIDLYFSGAYKGKKE